MELQTKTMLEKLKDAAPYNLFYNSIPDLPETHHQPNAIVFTDLLCPSLGQLKRSFHTNFTIDIKWLMKHYEARNLETTPMTILYGENDPEMEEYIETNLPNVTAHCFQMTTDMKTKPGAHHSKIGIFVYDDDSLRVVVSTAHHHPIQWEYYNNGLWMSPPCPRLPEDSSDSAGESPTGFKSSLVHYLQQYDQPAVLDPWLEDIKKADFSSVQVCLVTSVPGLYPPDIAGSHCQQVGDLLRQHCILPQDKEQSWPIIAQASCIGFMGESPNKWFRGSFLRSLAAHRQSKPVYISSADLKMIFPSVNNVKSGHFSTDISAEGLRYIKGVHRGQMWLRKHLHQWKADRMGRSGIMPHTRTYCRVSPCSTKLAWFLITSANVAKNAWGYNLSPNDPGINVANYEVGVLFLPKFFGEEYFTPATGPKGESENLFPVLYDLPLRKYEVKDHPWLRERMEKPKQKYDAKVSTFKA